MKQRPRLMWATAVLGVLLVSLFFKNGLRKNIGLINPSLSEAETTTSLPAVLNLATSTTLMAAEQRFSSEQKEFQSKVAECFSSPALLSAETPEVFFRNLITENPVQESQFEMENTHIQLPDGSLRRLHLIPSDRSNNSKTLELRYFKLDADGLPQRIPLSKEQTFHPKPEFIQSLKDQGKVVFHQTKEHQLLKDGAQVSLDQVDDKIFEMQIFSADKTFSCRAMKCECRK